MVEICTQYAQKGMFNIFLTVFFSTLAFAFLEPYFFIGYLISIALFGLYQAIFMANAGGAWDNAKKVVEVELKEKGTPLHAATVVGDTVGDPFKDTSSVAMNPVIKFTTLFGLLAVELAVTLTAERGAAGQPRAGGGLLRHLDGVRLAVVLRHADRQRWRADGTEAVARSSLRHRSSPTGRRSTSWCGGADTSSSPRSCSPRPGSSSASSCPGDSLLITAGLVAAAGGLDIWC